MILIINNVIRISCYEGGIILLNLSRWTLPFKVMMFTHSSSEHT